MFIAHLPAGYLLTITLIKRAQPGSKSAVMVCGLLGALAPDIDLLYFYLIDHRQTHHHQYLTHLPLFWLSLLIIFTVLLKKINHKSIFLAWIFCLNSVFHLILDTIVGDIWWFAPFI